jgi:hypothetical protein
MRDLLLIVTNSRKHSEQETSLVDSLQICSTIHLTLSTIDFIHIGSMGICEHMDVYQCPNKTCSKEILRSLSTISCWNMVTRLCRIVQCVYVHGVTLQADSSTFPLDKPYICVFVKGSDESMANFIAFFTHSGQLQMKVEYDHRFSLRQLICDESSKGNCICK